MTPAIGRSVRRQEDRRLLMGRGKYAADFRLPGMLHAGILRSPHAHARLHAIRAKAALGLPGVMAVVTAEDLGDIGRIPVRLGPRPSVVACLQPPLAREKVRYVGEPVALVVAESRYVAEDALADVKEAIKGDNKTSIETKLKVLGEASAGMAQRLYANQQQGAPSGDQPGGAGGGGDNVVDAEFEEVKDDQRKGG